MAQSTSGAQAWAQAILDLAVARNELGAMRQQLEELATQVESSQDLRNVFSNPTIGIDERKKVLGELGQAGGWSTTLRNTMMLMADRRRLGSVGAIAREFIRLADAREGIVRADVVAATELNEAQRKSLAATLSALTGKQVIVRSRVDAGVVGGLRVHVDGRIYDTTVRAQLADLRQSILKELH